MTCGSTGTTPWASRSTTPAPSRSSKTSICSTSSASRWRRWASRSLSAHLAGFNVYAGQAVNANTVIGWAGGSGNGVDNYWGSHLHQGLYLNASMSSGGTYGGQSAQQTNVHYCRYGCSYYYSLISKYQTLSY